MQTEPRAYEIPRRSARTAFAMLVLAVCFLALPVRAQNAQVVDIARQSITHIPSGMTSMNIAIHGVTIGMPWSQARNILDMANVPYIFQKADPPVVYIPPQNPTYYFVLNSSSYEVTEMGIVGISDLPIDNQYLFDAQRWRLTTARIQFFGNEGEYIVNEEGEAYNFPYMGFVLKYVNPNGFRFIMVTPTNKPLTSKYSGQTATPPVTTPPPTQTTTPTAGNLQQLLDLFQSARLKFENKNYRGALADFQHIAQNSTDDLLRVRSIYWSGESYYGMRQFRDAKSQFQAVLAETDIESLRDPAQLMIRNCNKALRR